MRKDPTLRKKILIYNVEFTKKHYTYGSYRDHLKRKHPKHDFTNLATLAKSKDTSVKKQVCSVSFETPFFFSWFIEYNIYILAFVT